MVGSLARRYFTGDPASGSRSQEDSVAIVAVGQPQAGTWDAADGWYEAGRGRTKSEPRYRFAGLREFRQQLDGAGANIAYGRWIEIPVEAHLLGSGPAMVKPLERCIT